jgi:hypothetical protein
MERFPELEKKYQMAYRSARAKANCGSCDLNGVIRSFRQKLEQRQKRDK